LADDLSAPSFLHPGWILAWHRAFSARRLTVLCARRQGELVGALPCVERWGVLRSPTNWHTPEFGFLARDSEVRTALAAALIEEPQSGIDISFLNSDDAALRACIQAASERGRRTIVRTMVRSPYVDLSGGDWDSFCATLDAKVRKELRRLRRRLDEEGTVTVDFVDGSSDIDRLLREGFSIEGSGWKQRRGTAITSEPRTERFYTDIARWAASRGELLMAFLRLDGRPIAFDLCLEAGGRAYALKGGFDSEFRRYGPGILLTYESLRRAFARGLVTYELLGAADRYKLVWTATVRERVRLQVFKAASPGGFFSWVAWAYGRPLVRSARAVVRRRS
jgi:CelD/BcsL family acetyltransferase involved in cellulose biosynthesis